MSPQLEVINTGTELLLGSVVNTHLKFIAEALFPIGLRIARQVTVPDGTAIADALAEACPRSEVVLITGGLGPTTDDLTRDAVAELLGLELLEDESVLATIEEFFASRNLVAGERVALQAQRPKEATVLVNPFGTAPGLYLPPLPFRGALSPHLFLLPGPPRELKPMFTHSVVPMLQALFPDDASVLKRTYRVMGVGESAVEEKVGKELLALGLELGYCARPGEVDVRLIGGAAALGQAETLIYEKLGRRAVFSDPRPLENLIVEELEALGRTLATAESCTGGYLAHTITNIPGASSVFVAGIVAYANETKIRDLGVSAESIERYGAVSPVVATEMALGAVRNTGSDYALATTGIAGPGGGSPEKPVGTVYIAVARKDGGTKVEARRFNTDRETFKSVTARAALDLLRREISYELLLE